MITFHGTIPEPMEWRVDYDTGTGRKPLPMCREHVHHSPDGFAWGYAGSGPAQLAFAILNACYGTDFARSYYQQFKQRILARLDKDRPFTIRFEKVSADWPDCFKVSQMTENGK